MSEVDFRDRGVGLREVYNAVNDLRGEHTVLLLKALTGLIATILRGSDAITEREKCFDLVKFLAYSMDKKRSTSGPAGGISKSGHPLEMNLSSRTDISSISLALREDRLNAFLSLSSGKWEDDGKSWFEVDLDTSIKLDRLQYGYVLDQIWHACQYIEANFPPSQDAFAYSDVALLWLPIKTTYDWKPSFSDSAEPAFWPEWFRLFLGGDERARELLLAVSEFSQTDWQKGPDHIEKMISELEASFLIAKTITAEDLFYNDDTARGAPPSNASALRGAFDVVPVEISQPEGLERAVSKVEDSFQDALTIGHGQHVRADSIEGLILNRVFTKYRHDPHRVEMDFEDVRRIILKNTCTEEQPNRNYPQKDELDLLVGALTIACGDIRAAYADVAKAREKMDDQEAPAPLLIEQKEQMAAALPVLRAYASERLGQGFAEDIGELVNDAISDVPDTAPRVLSPGERIVTPRKSTLRRLAYRVASMRVELGKVVDRINEAPEVKLALLIGSLGGLVVLLAALV